MKCYTIYMHIVPDGGVYIGATTQRPADRWHSGSGYKKQPKFYAAITKYGWDAIEHRILETGLTEEEAEQKEREYIEKYDATGTRGYNADLGGRRAGKHSQETRRKIGEAFAGEKHWNYGRTTPDESKAKVLQTTNAYSGIMQFDLKGNYIKTYRYSWEIVADIGGNVKNYTQCCEGFQKTSNGFQWRYVGDEEKHPVTNCEKSEKVIIQYDRDGNFIKRWTSAKEVAKALGGYPEKYRHCAQGHVATACGYVWKYETASE